MAAVLKGKTDHTPEFRQTLTRLTLRNDTMFYVALLYSQKHVCEDPLVVRGKTVVAATDGVTIYYDAKMFSEHSLEDRQFILVHEILHGVLYHTLRRGIREPNLWNIACDYVVNGMIEEGGSFKTPKDGIQPDPAFKDLSAEQVYDLLQKEAQEALKGGKSKGDGKNGRKWVRGDPDDGEGDGQPGDGGPSLDGKASNDVRDYQQGKDGDDRSAKDIERQIGIDTEKAIHAAKAAGQGSHVNKKLLDAAQVQHEPWYSHLRRFMTVLNAKEYNWSRINMRRTVFTEVLSPQMKSESMGDIVLLIDESGSLQDRQLCAIGAHSAQIFKECAPKRVIIIRHTDEVTDVEIIEGPDFSDFVLQRKSTGGTDFRGPAAYVEQNFPEAQVIVWFTDMYGAFAEGSTIETIWVTSTDPEQCKAPYGERIQADFND